MGACFTIHLILSVSEIGDVIWESDEDSYLEKDDYGSGCYCNKQTNECTKSVDPAWKGSNCDTSTPVLSKPPIDCSNGDGNLPAHNFVKFKVYLQ